MVNLTAIIGGTGLDAGLDGFQVAEELKVTTPYAELPVNIVRGYLTVDKSKRDVCFLSRHGNGHHIAPHLVNYRANIFALKELGVEQIIAINAVGGLTQQMAPQAIAVPNQIIDYSHSRDQTFFDSVINELHHIDFSQPYTPSLRQKLLESAAHINLMCVDGGVYGCTQGPRLETAAEIIKLQRDGCDLVGMTGMPEAALARELNIKYASICAVVNWGAGMTETEINLEEIKQNLDVTMTGIQALLVVVLSSDNF